jgi:antitoxin VapB
MPSLNIKDEEVYRLAKQLADRHNTSMTRIIAETLRERAEREKRDIPGPDDPNFVTYWMNRTEATSKDPNEPELSLTHGDLLYDENGLP